MTEVVQCELVRRPAGELGQQVEVPGVGIDRDGHRGRRLVAGRTQRGADRGGHVELAGFGVRAEEGQAPHAGQYAVVPPPGSPRTGRPSSFVTHSTRRGRR